MNIEDLNQSPFENQGDDRPKDGKASKGEGFWFEILKFGIIAVVIVIPFRIYIASPFLVQGASMFPTFNTGDYLVIDRLSYKFSEPSRDDVIVFRYPLDPSKFFIKRIVGLPGESVSINKDIVMITTNDGEKIELENQYNNTGIFGDVNQELSDNEYFVMGDNRAASSDSRVWGPLPKDNISGKPLIRLFPITKIGLAPGEITN